MKMVDVNHIQHGKKSQMHIKMDIVIQTKIQAGKFYELKLLLENKNKLHVEEKETASQLIKKEITSTFVNACICELQKMKVLQRWRIMKRRACKKYQHFWN